MSYYLHNPYFYNSGSVVSAPNSSLQQKLPITYSDYKSNRMTRKGQLIEEESMLRRLKVTSRVQSAHREQEILAMTIKHQIHGMNLYASDGQKRKVKLTQESQIIAQKNQMEFAVIEGCRNIKKQANFLKGHAFPSYISSERK